jgi:hypothetical protein
MFRLSLTLVAAALTRGACALSHHVRVRALGAIMCAVAFAIGSPFSFTARALQALRQHVEHDAMGAIRSRPAFSSYASTC